MSNPSTLTNIGSYVGSANVEYASIILSQDGLTGYIADSKSGNGLIILDLRLATPTLLGSYPAANNGQYFGIALSLDGTIAYITD